MSARHFDRITLPTMPKKPKVGPIEYLSQKGSGRPAQLLHVSSRLLVFDCAPHDLYEKEEVS